MRAASHDFGMGNRGFLRAVAAGLAVSGAVFPARAEPPAQSHWAEPQLQGFFDALQDARSPEEARRIEASIERRLARSHSPTIDLLMDRARTAASSGDLSAARELLTKCIVLDPEYAEAYRLRGDLAARQHQYALAIDDLEQAVTLQPRHYLALQSLGKLYEDGRDRENAIASYQSALALDPWLEPSQTGLKRLGQSLSQFDAANAVKPGAKAADSKLTGRGGV
jgi:tetratricopeptide (TPR) repeat protein